MIEQFAKVARSTAQSVLGSGALIIPASGDSYSVNGIFSTTISRFNPDEGIHYFDPVPSLSLESNELKHSLNYGQDTIKIDGKIWIIHDSHSQDWGGLVLELHEPV